ncbi:MAG: hypothetical protein HYZ63_01660 [Candidatus Andersenbacteria bacterium]|nr:hypothetical protein [Candidatus Andersenbacteria bacterium]
MNPETTEVFGSPESFHVLLRGQKGDAGCPYPPEVVQRRNNTFGAVLGITLRWVNPPDPLPVPYGVEKDLLACLLDTRFVESGNPLGSSDLELVLMKMPRPAAPKGVEWNAPGGVLNLKEDVTGGMLREHKEELLGMRVIASSIVSPFEQYCSGTYRESYSLGVVLAVGEPRPSPSEQARGIKLVPWRHVLTWIENQNGNSPSSVSFCGVDGKVEHGLFKFAKQAGFLL